MSPPQHSPHSRQDGTRHCPLNHLSGTLCRENLYPSCLHRCYAAARPDHTCLPTPRQGQEDESPGFTRTPDWRNCITNFHKSYLLPRPAERACHSSFCRRREIFYRNPPTPALCWSTTCPIIFGFSHTRPGFVRKICFRHPLICSYPSGSTSGVLHPKRSPQIIIRQRLVSQFVPRFQPDCFLPTDDSRQCSLCWCRQTDSPLSSTEDSPLSLVSESVVCAFVAAITALREEEHPFPVLVLPTRLRGKHVGRGTTGRSGTLYPSARLTHNRPPRVSVVLLTRFFTFSNMT